MHQIPLRGRARRKIRVGKDFSGLGGSGGTAAGQGATTGYIDFYNQGLVDIEDKQADRYLNQKWGTFWSVPHFEFRLQQFGTAVVGTAHSGLVLRAPRDLVIHDVTAMTAVSPGSTSINVDVKLVATPTAAGTSIFASGSAPSIGTSVDFAYVNGTASISNYSWGSGTFIRAEISQVGSGSGNPTGKDISVRIGATLPIQNTTQTWEVGAGASSANSYTFI